MGTIISFEYPFIYFKEYGVKFALVFLIIFCIELVIILICGRYNNEISFEINLKSMSLGEKNRLIKYAIIYIMLIGAYYFKIIANITPNSQNILIEVSTNYLTYEAVISIIIVFVNFISYFLISKNKDTFYNLLNKVVATILYLSVFATLITKQIDLFKINNFICYIFLGFIFIILLVCKVNPSPLKNVEANIFQAVENYDDLFPSHQSQAVELINIIKHSTSISICIAGEWGSGKTSLVNSALNELKSKEKNEYEIIRVNALEIDTTQSLFLYVFSRIKQCLKNKGVYVGIGSEYESFISASMGVLTNDTFGSLISKSFFSKPTDYRTQKASLEEVIHKSLVNDKIIVIVDDIERCNNQKAIEFIFFIKEIATMQNCVAIFITDYEQLIKSELIIKRKDNYMFFEKFFNYRINLVSVPLCESMTFYEKSKIFNKILFYNEFKKPSEIYDNIILLLNKKIQKAEQKNEVADLSKQLQHFIELLQHPRKTAKFYYVYSIFCTTINSEYLKLKDDASEWETVIVYYNKIDISKVVFILSYIQACLPTEFEQIQLKRISRYIDLLNNDDKENESRLLIIALCEDILFTKSSSIHISYEQMEVIKFIDALLINNADMINLVNSFTSQEQEWFDAIDNDQIGDIDASWSDIFDAILQNFSYSNIETGEHYIHKLFEFAIKEIKCKNIDINDIYQIFSPSLRNERWFTLNLYTMKGFYCSFCKTEIMNFLTDESIKYIRQFSLQFINFRFEVINKLIGYLLKYEEKEILDTAKDLMHNWKDNIEDRIIPFFEEIYRIDYLSDKIVDGKDFFVYLEDLYNLLSSYMEESKLSAYSDVQKDLNSMKLSIEDMRFFVQLINFQPGQKKSFNVADINKGDLEDTIKYFQDRFDNITDKLSLWHEFNKLFDYIRYEKDVKITSSQLKELHDLITIYIKESGHETMYYRKVLLDYAKLNHIELVN